MQAVLLEISIHMAVVATMAAAASLVTRSRLRIGWLAPPCC